VKRAVDFTDRSAVADWIAALNERVLDLADIAAEACKPRRARTVSRAHLRSEIEATVAELRAMVRAARRGIRAGAPTEPPPAPEK
jgi:acyl transferase domain-containing protein